MRAHHGALPWVPAGGGAWAPPGLGGPQGPVGVAFSEAVMLMPGPTYRRPGGAARILRHFCFSSGRLALARAAIPRPRCLMPCPRMIEMSHALRSCPARSRTGSPGQQSGSRRVKILVALRNRLVESLAHATWPGTCRWSDRPPSGDQTKLRKSALGGQAKTRKSIVTILEAPGVRLCGAYFSAPFGVRVDDKKLCEGFKRSSKGVHFSKRALNGY